MSTRAIDVWLEARTTPHQWMKSLYGPWCNRCGLLPYEVPPGLHLTPDWMSA